MLRLKARPLLRPWNTSLISIRRLSSLLVIWPRSRQRLACSGPPSAIAKDISRCVHVGVKIGAWAYEQCVFRKVLSQWRPEKMKDLRGLLTAQREGYFTLHAVPEMSGEEAQENLVLFIMTRLTEKGASFESARGFLECCGD